MQGARLQWVSIAGSEVYPDSEVDLTASLYKFQKGIQFFHLSNVRVCECASLETHCDQHNQL